jgi:hypothetical protein
VTYARIDWLPPVAAEGVVVVRAVAAADTEGLTNSLGVVAEAVDGLDRGAVTPATIAVATSTSPPTMMAHVR